MPTVTQVASSSFGSSSNKRERPPLSNYGDADQRQFHPVLSSLWVVLEYALYVAGCILPVVLLVFGSLVHLDLIPKHVLFFIITVIGLDYVVPLPCGIRPNQRLKRTSDRMAAEIAQLYLPGRSLFLPKNLSKDKAYIWACWPHALLAGGGHLGFCDFEQRGFFPIYSGASVMRFIPLVRRIIYSLGYVEVTKKEMNKIIDVRAHGATYPYNILHLVAGGIQEMFYTPHGAKEEQIVLSCRMGFIKQALRSQCDIIPTYSFGTNQLYARIPGPDSIWCKLSKAYRVSLLFWYGRWWIPFGFVPFQVPVLTVIGEVFEVPKVANEEVTDKLVQKVHQDFCQALRKLFEQYKHVYVEEMGADPFWRTRKLKFEDE